MWAIGAVAAFSAVRKADPHASLNLLWVFESARCGDPWQAVARKRRIRLLLALDAFEQQH